jgi:predicted nuclease with TOPRIM domain
MCNIQIESDLKEVLGEINSKLGKVDERLNNIEISQARLAEKFDAQEKIVTELKDSQNCY